MTGAERSRATAVVEGPSFTLPPGARGRLVEPGAAPRLRCWIEPWSEALAAELRASPLLELVREGAQVRLVQHGGDWLLCDDLHPPDPERALFALPDADLDRARDVLEHYFSYALPLRLAASITDRDVLKLRVLACPSTDLPAAQAQDPDLPEATTAGTATYDVLPGTRVCFRVHNAKAERLRVTLLDAAASGQVQILGDQVIEGGGSYVFWTSRGLGKPFAMNPVPGRRQGIDRLIAVGTTSFGTDLGFLRTDRKLSQILGARRGDLLTSEPAVPRDADDAEADARKLAIVEQWTVTQAIIWMRPRPA